MPMKLVLLLLLLAGIPTHQQNQTLPELITASCEKTTYKDLCGYVLGDAPKTEVDDLSKLTKFLMKMVSLTAGEIHRRLENQTSATQYVIEKQCLRDCCAGYQHAVDQLEDSMVALDAKNYKDVETWVAAAINDATSCESGCKGIPGDKSSLTALNQQFIKLCSIVLTLIGLLPKT